MDETKAEIGKKVPDGTPDYWRGLADGYAEAMRTMYPNAEEFLGSEPDATALVVKHIALRELSNGD